MRKKKQIDINYTQEGVGHRCWKSVIIRLCTPRASSMLQQEDWRRRTFTIPISTEEFLCRYEINTVSSWLRRQSTCKDTVLSVVYVRRKICWKCSLVPLPEGRFLVQKRGTLQNVGTCRNAIRYLPQTKHGPGLKIQQVDMGQMPYHRT
jgi:hypothetical protein